MTHGRIHILLGILTLAVLAASCRKEPLPYRFTPYTGTEKIQIKPTLDGDWVPVKAAWDPVDQAALEAGGFGVYALYTGTEAYSATKDSSAYTHFGLVYKNRRFYYENDTWKYEGKDEYWPTSQSDHLSFFAYAPYTYWNGSVAYDGKVVSIPYTAAASLSESVLQAQRDLLWGTNASGFPHRDVQATDMDSEGVVDMHFRHAVAKVNFAARGMLAGVNDPAYQSSVARDPEYGDWTAETPGEYQTEDPQVTSSSVTEKDRYYETTGSGYSRSTTYYITYEYKQTQRQNRSRVHTSTRVKTEKRDGVYTVSGNRYFIESVQFKGFNQSGTLLLDNTVAREPVWTNLTPFGGNDPEYTLNSGNVLTPSLQYVNPVPQDPATLTGVVADPVDLMSGYSLYAIPKTIASASDEIQVRLTYHKANVTGQMNSLDTRELVQTRTRTGQQYRERSRTSNTITNSYSRYGGFNEYYYRNVSQPGAEEFAFDDEWDDVEWDNFASNEGWGYNTAGDGQEVMGGYSTLDGQPGAWVVAPQNSTISMNYNDDYATTLSGSISTPLEGGRAYTINLVLAGDKIELDVVPRPWSVEDTEYDYTADNNEAIQYLTCDTDSVDEVDSEGNVYVGSRVAHFFFQLGKGKYVAWQATLVGDAAFGFTDAEGNFLMDGPNRVSSIRGDINPTVTNHIYVRALDPSAAVSSRAKLRLYYVDANSRVTAALDLVNIQGINEFTLIQNAN